MTEKKLLIGVLWFFYLFSNVVMAEGKAYKIELVVFAQDMPSSEVFDQYQTEIDWPPHVVDLSSYRPVSQNHMSLNGIAARLGRVSGYRPLLHVAWTQSVKPHHFGSAVRIRNRNGSLDGFFRLQRGHYLHMIADLEYSPNGSLIYRLNERRRFKLNEIHYLDHPKFGVIARVSPLS